MIVKTEKFQKVCTKILKAVDSNPLSEITETLELIGEDDTLYMNITNRDYYVSSRIELDDSVDEFRAAVNASQFLKLICQVTTEAVELTAEETYLKVKANGVYRIPMIFNDDELLSLPVITIENVTNEFDVPTNIFKDILKYNSKELLKRSCQTEVQRLYYVDEEGCVTFSSGACVTEFNLPKKVKLLLSDKIVKLTSLFKGDKIVFTIGQDIVGKDIVQTKVRFADEDIRITAILVSNDRLISRVPATGIRKRAFDEYNYNVVVPVKEMLSAINRLLVFKDRLSVKAYAKFDFTSNGISIIDLVSENVEKVNYCNDCKMLEEYTACVDVLDVKAILDTCSEEYINIKFGNKSAVVLARGNISNVIPEAIND